MKTIVAIDAPLSYSDKLREVDKEMIRKGYRVFPPGFSFMKLLTLRGIRLAKAMQSLGIEVIETHPRSALKSSNCLDVESLLRALSITLSKDLDIGMLRIKDIRDAVVSALVALCYEMKCSEKVENIDGVIWLIRRIC